MCQAIPLMHSHAPHDNRLTTMRHTPKPPRKPLILVVEDHDSARTALTKMLSSTGYDVAEAQNGSDALAQLATGPRPDLILLDLMMPVMDGWEFRRRQQADPAIARVPVIVLSALDPGRASNVNAAAFLKKPLDFDRLLQLVRDHCS